MTGSDPSPIARLSAADLTQGCLWACFRAGAAAVIIESEPAVAELWRCLTAQTLMLPWRLSLYHLAANLIASDDLTEVLGDVYYFKPGRHSYIGRKIEIEMAGGALSARPGSFSTRSGAESLPPEVMLECWSLSRRIMSGLMPVGSDPVDKAESVKVAVQLLKYHDSPRDHDALFRMVRSSLGPWGRIGYRLDGYRETMAGPLSRRGVSDALALISLFPLARKIVNRLNRLIARFDARSRVPEGLRLLTKAHTDSRYFSALCGNRDNLTTEIFAGGRWLPLPIDSTNIAILPGSRARAAFGIPATLHRVLQAENSAHHQGSEHLRNVTLLLGAK